MINVSGMIITIFVSTCLYMSTFKRKKSLNLIQMKQMNWILYHLDLNSCEPGFLVREQQGHKQACADAEASMGFVIRFVENNTYNCCMHNLETLACLVTEHAG